MDSTKNNSSGKISAFWLLLTSGFFILAIVVLVIVGFAVITYQNSRMNNLQDQVVSLQHNDDKKPPVQEAPQVPTSPSQQQPVNSQQDTPKSNLVRVDVPRRDEDVLCPADKVPELTGKIAKYDQNQKRIDDNDKTVEKCKNPENPCYLMDLDDLMALYDENEILLKEISSIMVSYCQSL